MPVPRRDVFPAGISSLLVLSLAPSLSLAVLHSPLRAVSPLLFPHFIRRSVKHICRHFGIADGHLRNAMSFLAASLFSCWLIRWVLVPVPPRGTTFLVDNYQELYYSVQVRWISDSWGTYTGVILHSCNPTLLRPIRRLG
jgi:hypothetical protein